MSEFIENIALRINEQIEKVEAKRDRRTGRYLMDASEDSDELTGWHYRIGALFRQLQLDINLSALEALDEQIADHRLEAMTPVKLAAYNSIISMEINRRGCTEGTRVQVLDTINTWARTMGTPNIYWMNGMAGTGKTTIAYTFAKKLKERKLLGASFFCTRTSAECGNVGRIVPTLAYQLARYSTPFRSSLCRVLGNDRDLGSQTITTQFEELIMKPLLEVKDVVPEGLIIIIDALDECSHTRGTAVMLDVLFKYAGKLPLKFFVTSRPEPHIRNNIRTQSEHLRSVFVLHEIESSLVQEDIELYLREELAPTSPSHAQVKRLAELSGNLFIYAATAVRYIQVDNTFSVSTSSRRLATVLDISSQSNQKHAEIDDLYTTILSSILRNKSLEDKDKEQMQTILWTVICACEPLKIETLTTMARIESSEVTLDMLQPFYSVLYVSERNNIASVLHASFPDYMLDQNRSRGFYCDKNANNECLSRRCFELMEEQLRFNICNLLSSFVADKDVEGLEDRIELTISNPLTYACHYWGNHLQNSVHSEFLFNLLWNFLSRKLLFWMEVLNLKQTMGIGIDALTAAAMWVAKSSISHHGDLPKLVQDCVLFTMNFHVNPISYSTPHIYISALPFCHKSSLVFRLYWGCTQGLLGVDGTALKEQGISSLAVWETGSVVSSLSISPDGRRLVVGYRDGSITLNDAHSGSVISCPTKLHSSVVNSVAFSPDGTCFASGSINPTICIWSAHSGSLVASNHHIWHAKFETVSVAFSPDGRYIASGSSDHSICIWDAYNCSPVANLRSTFTHKVSSVAFSPDGQTIAFGCGENILQMCSTVNGSFVRAPCMGHTSQVWTVVYSPDGHYIASGSRDGTIRVWDAHESTLSYGPFNRYTGEVHSVMFSPNGLYLVSASDDQSICVWNVRGGTVLGQPLTGHRATVKSVTFSPDGSRIFSGSKDGSIRVWGVPNELTSISSETTRLVGHSDAVESVVFSSNGTYIISGSSDGTICTWRADDGSPLANANPLVRHDHPVSSLALSSDGAYIVYGSADGSVRICNAQGVPDVVLSNSHSRRFWIVIAYSRDASLVVSSSATPDNAHDPLRIWHRIGSTFAETSLEGHTGRIYSITISPSKGYIVSGSRDKTMRIWKRQNGQYGEFQCIEHSYVVGALAFSPDSTSVASASGQVIRIWSVHDGALVYTFSSVASEIFSLSYSCDGLYIVSGSFNADVIVWNTHTGSPIAGPFLGHTGCVRSVAFSPSGEHIVSGSDDKTIRIWKPPIPVGSVTQLDAPSCTDLQTEGVLNSILKGDFIFENSGWIKSRDSRLVFWFPSDIASMSPSPQSPIIITPKGSISMDFNYLLLGEQWNRCYTAN
ncbi:unnamed protein product [Rhizoctonia solani]|uniref:NACHT domain-containing protein n=1 Tax=Rhizoctonia solani TaxID=456999 RepID=A0A8H2XTA7_9AGAM|nr:unnamed protein product [Rhizoctonia solani]